MTSTHPADVHEMLTSTYITKPKPVTGFEYLQECIQEHTKANSLARKIMEPTERDCVHSEKVTATFYIDSYSEAGSTHAVLDALFQDIIKHLFDCEERVMFRDMYTHAGTKIDGTFTEIWDHVKQQPQHACHAIGRKVWTELVMSLDKSVQDSYVNNERHEQVMNCQFGYFKRPGYKEAPIYSDMYRLSKLRRLDDDVYFHLKELLGTYNPSVPELNITSVDDKPALVLNHEFKYTYAKAPDVVTRYLLKS